SRFPITVEEVVGSGLINMKMPKGERKDLTDETIRLIGLGDHRHKSIGSLSGGQLQRALMGRAIISRPEVLVLDEPLSYVDKQFEHRIYEIIESMRPRTTMVLVSHEMSTISGMATRHVMIDHTLTECHAAHHKVHYDCDCL
ncbi:MAG: ATP-binding cassette domain-containing protein, partial [Duncaniella sp.]|nr:ATP-binding cassette domain-containing protein [Duncaniella sp.]